MKLVKVIDSHTGGEPTRVVVQGAPELGAGSLVERRNTFRDEFDSFRSAVVNEPRGSDALVGAVLVEPVDSSCVTGVIFFNNVDYLGMCGHGMMGVVVTLGYMGKIEPGEHRIETPVGVVTVWLHDSGRVTIKNVPSFRKEKDVTIDVDRFGTIVGDVAWGGNWFFLTAEHGQVLTLENLETLSDLTWKIRQSLTRQGITGDRSEVIDHIELFGPPTHPDADVKNFVLCPGRVYDRSPCGTGTSAKLACLYTDGKLKPGEMWRQESLIGSLFEGSVEVVDGQILPYITGSAFVTAEATLLLDPADPFNMGIRASK